MSLICDFRTYFSMRTSVDGSMRWKNKWNDRKSLIRGFARDSSWITNRFTNFQNASDRNTNEFSFGTSNCCILSQHSARVDVSRVYVDVSWKSELRRHLLASCCRHWIIWTAAAFCCMKTHYSLIDRWEINKWKKKPFSQFATQIFSSISFELFLMAIYWESWRQFGERIPNAFASQYWLILWILWFIFG